MVTVRKPSNGPTRNELPGKVTRRENEPTFVASPFDARRARRRIRPRRPPLTVVLVLVDRAERRAPRDVDARRNHTRVCAAQKRVGADDRSRARVGAVCVACVRAREER